MPAINSSPLEEVIKAIKNTPAITSLLAKDKNNVVSVRPEDFQPIGTLFPQITVAWNDDKSDSKIPSTSAHLRISIWCGADQQQPFSFLKGINDSILKLFNRTGFQFNNIDVPTNTGVNFNQFIKVSGNPYFDDKLRKFCSETVFKVVVGEGQSYIPSDSGNLPWV